MAYVQPASPRFIVSQGPEGIRIAIPARHNWFIVLFLLCWLGGWTFGEMSAISDLLNGKDGGFLLFWLGGWTIGGIWAAYMVLWMLNGQELLLAKRYPPCLSAQRQLFGVPLRSQDFDPSQIRRLRVSSEIKNTFGFGSQQNWFTGNQNIAFDYGARTRYLGAGLDDAEAQMVIDAIQECWPSLMR